MTRMAERSQDPGTKTDWVIQQSTSLYLLLPPKPVIVRPKLSSSSPTQPISSSFPPRYDMLLVPLLYPPPFLRARCTCVHLMGRSGFENGVQGPTAVAERHDWGCWRWFGGFNGVSDEFGGIQMAGNKACRTYFSLG
jgi:hypothetical protein